MKLMGILAGLGTIAVGLKIAQQLQTTDESEIAGWAVALSPASRLPFWLSSLPSPTS
jgi:arabinofuranosyltransferase